MRHGVLVLEENAGVVEYWSIGVLVRPGCPSPHRSASPSLRYSTTPLLRLSLQKGIHQARSILNYFLECRTFSPIGER